MLVAVNSCDVLAYTELLSDVTLMIRPARKKSSRFVDNEFLLRMIDDIRTRSMATYFFVESEIDNFTIHTPLSFVRPVETKSWLVEI